MEDLRRCFNRNSDGSWLCIQDVNWTGTRTFKIAAGSRFTLGQTVLGADVAATLDAFENTEGERATKR
jgi:hypothetical protein